MAFGNTIYAYMLQQHAAQRAQAQQQAQLDQQASQFEAQRADGRRQELRQEVDQADAQKDQDFQRKFKIAQEYGRQAAARDENIPGFDNPALSEASELAFGAYPIEQKQAQDEREFKEKQWLLSLTGRQYAADKSNEGRHYAADARSGDVDKTLENKVDYRDLVLIPRNEEAVRNHDLQHQDRVATNGVRLSIAQTRAAATGKTPEMRKQGEFNAYMKGTLDGLKAAEGDFVYTDKPQADRAARDHAAITSIIAKVAQEPDSTIQDLYYELQIAGYKPPPPPADATVPPSGPTGGVKPKTGGAPPTRSGIPNQALDKLTIDLMNE